MGTKWTLNIGGLDILSLPIRGVSVFHWFEVAVCGLGGYFSNHLLLKEDDDP